MKLKLMHVALSAVLGDGGVPASGGAAPAVATTAPTAAPKADAVALLGLAGIPHPPVANRDYKFHFKKDDLGNKRPTLDMVLPVPTLDGVVEGLKDLKIQEYILEVLAEQVYKQARVQVGDEEKPVNSQDDLRLDGLTLAALANMPKAERTGGGISKEVWEAFAKDYIAIMPAITGFNAEQVGNASKLLLAKFQPVKTNKKVLQFLRDQLALYTLNTKELEQFQDCVDFLDNKADTLLKTDEASLLANLGG